LLFLPGSAIYAQTNGYHILVLPLGVQDRRGRFVKDIQREQIAIDGLAATVHHMELDIAPRRILLLLDTSGSMGNFGSLSWSNVAKFAIRFALQRNGEDSIGLDTFAEKDEVHLSFTTDSQSVVKHIEAITDSGKGRTMLGLALTEILARKDYQDTEGLKKHGERVSTQTHYAAPRIDHTRRRQLRLADR
jgi:hypothetical protein